MKALLRNVGDLLFSLVLGFAFILFRVLDMFDDQD